MCFDLAEIAPVLDADLVGDGNIVPNGLCLDSRSICPGECFVALRAERDGHQYAKMAIEGGASCLLVDCRLEYEVPQLVVGDTLLALQKWGQYRLEACRPKHVFGVTGSVGKTSTKELLAGATSAWKTPGNRNNTLGLPTALATIPVGLHAAVLEMGMSTPHEIERLTTIAPLDFGVITNVGESHIENFPKGIAGIATAKGELVSGILPGGAWVFPANDQWCQWISKQSWASKTTPIPVGEGADYSITGIESLGAMGERFSLLSPYKKLDIEIRLTGHHQILNAALAASIALVAGFDGDEIAHGLGTVEPEDGRGRLHFLKGGGTLLDESYNACRDSMLSCAKALLGLSGGEPVAVLGCIRELGASSASVHRAIGSELRRAGISRLWVYGDFSRELAEGFGQGALAFSDYDALEPVLDSLPSGARILVKGSRHWKTERAIAYILERFMQEDYN